MPAVLEAVSESVSEQAESVSARKRAPWLKPYHFKAGQQNPAKTNPAAHRQAGTPNAQTVYMESLPIKAKQWVKSTAPAVLIDARKIALPIDSDAPATVNIGLVGWFESRLASPALASPSRQMLPTDAVPALSMPIAATLSASAATVAAIQRNAAGAEANGEATPTLPLGIDSSFHSHPHSPAEKIEPTPMASQPIPPNHREYLNAVAAMDGT